MQEFQNSNFRRWMIISIWIFHYLSSLCEEIINDYSAVILFPSHQNAIVWVKIWDLTLYWRKDFYLIIKTKIHNQSEVTVSRSLTFLGIARMCWLQNPLKSKSHNLIAFLGCHHGISNWYKWNYCCLLTKVLISCPYSKNKKSCLKFTIL